MSSQVVAINHIFVLRQEIDKKAEVLLVDISRIISDHPKLSNIKIVI